MVWRGNRAAQQAEQAGARLARLLGEHPAQLIGRTELVAAPSTPAWPTLAALPTIPTPPTNTESTTPAATIPSAAEVDQHWLIPPAGHESGLDTPGLLSGQRSSQIEPPYPAAQSGRWWQTARVDPTRRGVVAAALSAAVILLILGVLLGVKLWQRDAAESAPVSLPASPSSSSQPRELVVAVSGQVRKPGLVRLPDSARVADAVQAAGGTVDGATLGNLNLARKVVDGELIVVGGPQPAPPANAVPGSASSHSAPPGRTTNPSGVLLDLNAATLAELDALPGVGPVTAQAILDYRNAHGRFGSIGELRKVDGIGEGKFAKLKPLVTV